MTLFTSLLPRIVIDSTNNALSVTVTGGTGAGTSTRTIASGTYHLRGDGAADDFLLALDVALEAHATTGTFACSVSRNISDASTGCAVTLTLSGGPTSWTINTSGTTFDLQWLGMSTGMTAALSLTSTRAVKGCWTASEPLSVDQPGFSARTSIRQLAGGSVNPHNYGSTVKRRRCEWDFLVPLRAFDDVDMSTPHVALAWLMYGGPFERHGVAISSGTTLAALSSSTRIGELWHLAQGSVDNIDMSRADFGVDLWSLELDLIGGEGV